MSVHNFIVRTLQVRCSVKKDSLSPLPRAEKVETACCPLKVTHIQLFPEQATWFCLFQMIKLIRGTSNST